MIEISRDAALFLVFGIWQGSEGRILYPPDDFLIDGIGGGFVGIDITRFCFQNFS